MTDDMDLVREYATRQSEPAFETLVSRHVNLVHSAALRQVRDPHLAEEITQIVFILLARKAAALSPKVILPGWLYRTTRYVSAAALKNNRRRERREQEAHMQATIQEPQSDPIWKQLSPLLDEAMAQLQDKDRDAIVLRYFQNKSLRDVGAVLGVDEYAAQKRVARATEKLRGIFAKHGAVTTTAIIAGAISINSVQAAPATLAKTAAAAALAKGAAASTSTSTIIKGTLKLMAWANAKTAVSIGVAALLAAGTTSVGFSLFGSRSIEDFFKTDANLEKAPPVLVLRPTHYPKQDSYFNTAYAVTNAYGERTLTSDSPANGGLPERLVLRNDNFGWILSAAFDVSVQRMVLPGDLPPGQFDLLLTLKNNPQTALREEIHRQFGLLAHTETRDMDVLVLKVADPTAPALKPSKEDTDIEMDPGVLTLLSFNMAEVSHILEGYFLQPIINETALTDRYDLKLRWNRSLKGDPAKKEIERQLREQLGLEMVPDHRPVQMFVFDYDPPFEVASPLPRESWASVGDDTPEAAFQSTLWAMTQADPKAFLASLTPEYQKRFLASDGRGKTDKQIAALNRHRAEEVVDFQITGKEIISDDESVLYFRSSTRGNASAMMKRINGVWKMDQEPH